MMVDNLSIRIHTQGPHPELVAFVEHAYTESDGAEEGAMVANLTRSLLDTPEEDLIVLTAAQDGRTVGCAIFSRLRFGDDPRGAFPLGPLAVAPNAQRMGLGGALVMRGNDELLGRGVLATFVYGNPNYYSRFGFGPAATQVGSPPFALTHPEGWLGQWLVREPEPLPFASTARCVDALGHRRYW